jgi:hypothetical protein
MDATSLKGAEVAYFSRWLALGAALVVCSVSAVAYAYGIFSDDLKDALGLVLYLCARRTPFPLSYYYYFAFTTFERFFCVF